NKNIAVIGAGPAGLSSAYDLVQNGYGVTVFEKQSSAGGMIASVIPDFRMDKVGMKNEIAVLNDMGVKFKFNTSLGKDIALEDLSKKFDSVILAVGMWQVPPLEIVENNISLSDRFDAISFLQQYNLKKLKLKPAANVLVIGGGNSAMDAARAAKQFDKKNNVIISCIETEDKMPAFKEEVKHALADGIQLNANSFVDAIAKENGRYEILLRSFDKKEVLEKIEVDYVITAIGQKGDPSVLNENIETDSSSRIKLVSGYTNVFAAGDILAGNHISLIGAIGSGKRAAVQVRKLLEDYKFEYEGETALNKLTSATGSELSRSETDNLNPEDIFNYDLYQPCAKCDHCIENFGCPAMVKVDGKIVIDDARCNRCGLCIDVCPNGAVEMIEEVIDLRK
ncbi:MAG TPA: FAD-dependent oxidoreductase, partial [Bacteroidia bacterium]